MLASCTDMEVKLVWDGDIFLIVNVEYEETKTDNALVQLSVLFDL